MKLLMLMRMRILMLMRMRMRMLMLMLTFSWIFRASCTYRCVCILAPWSITRQCGAPDFCAESGGMYIRFPWTSARPAHAMITLTQRHSSRNTCFVFFLFCGHVGAVRNTRCYALFRILDDKTLKTPDSIEARFASPDSANQTYVVLSCVR